MAVEERGAVVEPFLRAEQFERMYALLQQKAKIHTGERERERQFLEAVFWMCRSGAQWRLLPADYGAWNSVYKRFARWDDLGVWARLFERVADDPDMQSVMLDATVVRAHACAAGAPKKRAIRRRKGSDGPVAASARSSMCSSTRWGIR